jgi:hypothetical protein
VILNDIDIGGAHPWPMPATGVVRGDALIESSRTIVWPRGGVAIQHKIVFWVQAWQAVGGATAGSFQAMLNLLAQLEELSNSVELQPAYIQWATTAQPNPPYNAADAHDGWYVIEDFEPDYSGFSPSGFVECKATITRVAPDTPSSLGTWYSGGALSSSSYSGAATPLVAFPLGSSGQAPTQLSRTGGEGSVPLSLNPTPNPVPFVRPGTVAGLFAGMVRVFDTINTGSNPVPTSGGFSNANWLQVYGIQHDWTGDCVVTNGLLLLLFQLGQQRALRLYLWNTSLGTPAWQQVYDLQYVDGSLNLGTLREINLDRVSLQEARVRVRCITSAGNSATLKLKLQAGQYAASVEFWPETQNNASTLALLLALAATTKIIYDESTVQDVLVTNSALSTPSSVLGFGASFGQAANGPLFGFLYQNAPSVAQPAGNGTSGANLGIGDSSGPSAGSFRLYGIWAVPFATVPNLQAEAESGALGTGWSSIADGAASAGNAAKAASGTASGNADLFGTSWVPPAGMYDVWFRVKVTSAAGSATEMTLGLWDATSAAFVSGGSTTFRANQASTSYVWLKANGTSPLTPTAGHNMQFRAVTAATLGTDWFIDEAVLVPIRSSTLGIGSFPGDIWSQWMFDKVTSWARG